jgi:hypothetical protein
MISILRSFGGLVFDATIKEEHESELVVTDNPVEAGVQISDHAYMSPLKTVIYGGVSDTPLSVQPNDPFASAVSRSRRAFEVLTALQASRELFSIQTGLKLYKNMLCTGLRAVQDKDSATVFKFVAECREVIIVETEVVKYPPRAAGKTARQASKKRDKGEVNPDVSANADTPQAKAKKASLGKKLKTALFGK